MKLHGGLLDGDAIWEKYGEKVHNARHFTIVVHNAHQRYRIPTPQLNKIKKGLPRLPREKKGRVAGGYGTKSSSPSIKSTINHAAIDLSLSLCLVPPFQSSKPIKKD